MRGDEEGMRDSPVHEKVDIEQLLAGGQTVQIEPKGFSMYPMFYPGRDKAIICPVNPRSLKKGDVALFRREGGILVLHRILKRKGDGFYMVGDNQWEIEGPVKEGQIKGKLAAFIRKGRVISVEHKVYVAASRLWLFLCPIRKIAIKTVSGLKKAGKIVSSLAIRK
jgi:hypothetical protein